jgi:hypothetical protein
VVTPGTPRWDVVVAAPYDVDFEELPEPNVAHGSVLIVLSANDQFTPIVLDSSRDAFTRVAGLPRGLGAQPLALAADGRSLLL